MGYKAFKKGMICRGKQYAENTVYEESGANTCCTGGVMHYCETPMDVLDYYPLVDENGDFSEFAEVEPLDKVLIDGNKRATKKLRIGAKLSFRDFIKAAVSVVVESTKPVYANSSDLTYDGGNGAKIGSSGDGAQIGSSGDGAQIGSSGDGAQIGSSGDGAQIGSSGYGAKIGSSGNGAKIGSSGDGAQIGSSGNGAQIGSSGDGAKIGSSGYGAKIGSSGYGAKIGSSGNGAKIGSSGDGAKIGSSGYGAKIGSSGYGAKIGSSGDGAKIGSSGDGAKIGSSGDGAKIDMSGTDSVGAAIGHNSVVKGEIGNWIVLAEWKRRDNGKLYPACVKAGIIDGKNLKADTWYTLREGEFVEAE